MALLHIEVLFLQKVMKIFEITPTISVCRPRRYSRAALPGIFGRAGSGRKPHSSSFTICAIVEIATAAELLLMKLCTLKPDSGAIVDEYLDFPAVYLLDRKHERVRGQI